MQIVRSATTLTVASMLSSWALAAPAYADHTRLHTFEQLGGTFRGNSNPNLATCTFTTVVVGPAVQTGEADIDLGEPTPAGAAMDVESPATPTGEPTIDRDVNNVGDPVSVPVVVAGTPQSETRTVRGETTTTEAPGTQNCKRVNNGNGAHAVEKCERTVVTTSTTPTTESRRLRHPRPA
jgi:hypothetical protein